MMNKGIACAAVLCTLAACGSGGLPVSPYEKPPLDDSTRPAGPPGYVALYDATIETYSGLPSLVVTDLPDSGMAGFDGTALVVADGTDGGYLGAFTATIDFAAARFDGSADSFFYDPNEISEVAGTGSEVPGEIQVDATEFQPGLILVSAAGDLDGVTITDASGEVVLLGRSAEGLLGAIDMTLDTQNATMLLVADR